MRNPLSFAILLLAALPLGLAQSTGSSSSSSSSLAALAVLPKCALTCLMQVATASPCGLTNQTCLCTNQQVQLDVEHCVLGNCTIKEALFTKNVTSTNCHAPVRDKADMYNTVSITMGVISGVFVLARLVFKVASKMDLDLDDWFILLAIVSGIPSSVMNVHGLTANGLGKDIWTVPFDKITKFGFFFYLMAWLYFLQIMILKLSLLFFYLKIFPSKPVRRVLWGTVIFNVLFGISFVLVVIFQCQPISYYWDKWDGQHQGTCLDLNAITWSNAAISIALDIWMLAVPLSQLKSLNLHWKKKIGVGLMFTVGTFVTIVSILRLQTLVQFGHSSNPTWDNFDVANWSTIEINVGIICACMPSLRLMLVRVLPKVFGTTRRGTNYAYGSYGNRSQGNKYYVSSSSKNGDSRVRHNVAYNADGLKISHPNPDGKGILYQKSYTVEYGDNDEARLVEMGNLDFKSSKPRSNASESSL